MSYDPLTDDRPQLYVHWEDHSGDEVRTWFEIPDALAARVRAAASDSDDLTFDQAVELLVMREEM